MEKPGYISLIEMSMRDGINPRLLKRHIIGGTVRSRGNTRQKVRYEAGKLESGIDYEYIDGRIMIREEIRFIRGEFKTEEGLCLV